MRPIHMTVGDRHLVRIDVPGGPHVPFETPAEASGRDCGPAVVAPTTAERPRRRYGASGAQRSVIGSPAVTAPGVTGEVISLQKLVQTAATLVLKLTGAPPAATPAPDTRDGAGPVL